MELIIITMSCSSVELTPTCVFCDMSGVTNHVVRRSRLLQWARLSVYLRANLRNEMSKVQKLHQIFYVRCLWPWTGYFALCCAYFRFSRMTSCLPNKRRRPSWLVNKLDRRRVLLTTRSTCRWNIPSPEPEGSALFWGYPNFFTTWCKTGERKRPVNKTGSIRLAILV